MSRGLSPDFGVGLLPGLKPRPISGATAKASAEMMDFSEIVTAG